jgi:glucose-1-phosphate thymidylyltransferase
MKGIILAGGAGTRLHPITKAISKQLLPVYDKPMIYYPLSVLMLANIQDILIISTPQDLPHFHRLLGDGAELGLRLSYAEQPQPNGLAEAFIIGRDHIAEDSACLILGDNVFYGHGLGGILESAIRNLDGCTIFGYPVVDPERYGVPGFDTQGRLTSLEEKPVNPKSGLAITGLYFFDNAVVKHAAELAPSARGELEVTDIAKAYLAEGRAKIVKFGRGIAWLDTGTHDSLLEASQFVQILEHRQAVRIACLEEIALRQGFIDADAAYQLGQQLGKSGYGRYVMEIALAAKEGRL